MISIRDYAAVERGGTQVKPYGLRSDGAAKCLAFQVWEWREPWYDPSLYLVCDALGAACKTEVFRSTYYAITIPHLMALMTRAEFGHVERRDDVLFQPVLVGVRTAVDPGGA